MSRNLCCCSPCRPAFKRHVDAIYPPNPNDGLVKNKMETLTYYAVTSPEKLDRIGEYLEQRVSRDIYRGRKGLVLVGIEAMDQLIKSCHMNNINLFVESFLKTVGKLLESTDPDLQALASQSFSGFSQIKEDTPSYHRSYDFFIERFSQMCHDDGPERERLRLAGLQGLNGVIRKTVNEDLAENIWDPRHMDKIVPSLLYNLDPRQVAVVAAADNGDETPASLADQILRELVMAAGFSPIKAILRPVLQFMRDHGLWDEPGLCHAVHTFEAIMYSIQVDLSYLVIDKLMAHLDFPKYDVLQKASIAIVLSRIIGIGVGDSTVGPAVLEIINELLKHLKKSADKEKTYDQSSSAPLQQLQHALLDALGEYAAKMPDFQKIEIMTFIVNKVPHEGGDHEHQLILMKALYCVAEKHNTPALFSTTFSPQLLSTLLRLLGAPDHDVRLLVLRTFQILADRHHNREKLSAPSIEPTTLDLEAYPNTKPSRSDHMFVQKSLFNIFSHFRRALEEPGNSIEFLEAVYTTCALLHVETSGTDESVLYLLDLIVSVQAIAVSSTANLGTENRFALHAVAACLATLLAATICSAELDAYVDSVVDARAVRADHMLPPLSEQYHPGLDPDMPQQDEGLLFDGARLKEALRNAGKDVQRMDALPRRSAANNGAADATRPSPRSSWPDPPLPVSPCTSRRPSVVSSSAGSLAGGGSAASSPGIVRRPFCEDTSVGAFRKVLEGPTPAEREEEERRRRETQELFLHASMEVLNKFTARSRPETRDFLADIFARLDVADDEAASSNSVDEDSIMKRHQPYEKLFPELFLY